MFARRSSGCGGCAGQVVVAAPHPPGEGRRGPRRHGRGLECIGLVVVRWGDAAVPVPFQVVVAEPLSAAPALHGALPLALQAPEPLGLRRRHVGTDVFKSVCPCYRLLLFCFAFVAYFCFALLRARAVLSRASFVAMIVVTCFLFEAPIESMSLR